ncbi:MAG: MCE family protein [Bdellovibrionales bacterium]|nr:MCE family protein [Bdellovibrionales bacterium]
MAYDYSQRQSLKSGIFMFLGLITIIISIILLSGNNSLFKSNLLLKAKFKEVQGLNIGSVVSLSGINVGNVKDIDFAGEDVVVTLSVEKKFQNKVTTTSLASIKTQGALGDKYIFIQPGTEGSKELEDNDFIMVDSSGDFFDVINEQGPKLASITDVVAQLKLLLENLNKDGNSAKLIESLLKTSTEIQNMTRDGQTLISDIRGKNNKDLQQAIERLNSILGKIDRGEGSLGALINDPVVHDRLSSILGKPARNSYLKPLIRATIKSND